jgi:predicted nucleic acid-binding protein
MDKKIVLDSNAVIYQLNKKLDLSGILEPDCRKYISVITEIEALAKPGMTAEEEVEAKEFLSDCSIVDISPEIKLEAIRIRRGKKLRLPDAIIAATAVCLKAPILSNDSDIINL